MLLSWVLYQQNYEIFLHFSFIPQLNGNGKHLHLIMSSFVCLHWFLINAYIQNFELVNNDQYPLYWNYFWWIFYWKCASYHLTLAQYMCNNFVTVHGNTASIYIC